MLDAFGYSFIQHLAFHYCVECKAYAVECVSNVFINIWMSIICGVPQKIKRRKGFKPDNREEAKMASKTEKGSNAKKTGPMMRFSCLLTCSKQALAYGTLSHRLYQFWHKRDSMHGDRDFRVHKY